MKPGAPDERDGPRIDGYRVSEPIGEGGFGIVYRAERLSTGQIVAIKVLRNIGRRNREDTARRMARFARETRLCARLRHPNIVRILDAGETATGNPFTVFEYVTGDPLHTRLREKGALRAVDAGRIMAQVLDGLAHAHAQGIVHRDLKPSNIIVCDATMAPFAKILDFGIAGFLSDRQERDCPSITLPDEALGTPAYTAPEQLRGAPADPKSDLYAWGLTFLECLTSKPAVSGRTIAEVLHKQLSPTEIPLPPGIAAHPLSGLLRRVLKKDPRERIADAATVWATLGSLHLSDLVGDLCPPDACVASPVSETGAEWRLPAAVDRRYVTVLCCSVSVVRADTRRADLEEMERLQQAALERCTDVVSRFGGTWIGTLGDRSIWYFGYPHASDSDARLAANAALAVTESRGATTGSRRGLRVVIRAGIHSGLVAVEENRPPSGMAPSISLDLASAAPEGAVLVSRDIQQLLKKHPELDCREFEVSQPSISGSTYLLAVESAPEHLSRGPRGSTIGPLVGRRQEIESLEAAREAALSKSGSAWLIQGEPGIGKTRLLNELRIICGHKAHRYVEARCLPEHRHSALYPLLSHLKHELELEDGRPVPPLQRLERALIARGCDAGTHLPALCAWLSVPLPAGTAPLQHAPGRQKALLFEAVRALLFYPEEPLVFALEDLHWADPTTLELVGELLAIGHRSPLMLVFTARPDFTFPDGTAGVKRLGLAALPREEARALVDATLAGRPVPVDVESAIIGRSGGVPLFIEELVRFYLEEGAPDAQETEAHAGGGGPRSVPGSLAELLGARLRRLGPAFETASLASVIGREFERELLAKISLLDEAALQAHLATMSRAGVVERTDQVRGSKGPRNNNFPELDSRVARSARRDDEGLAAPIRGGATPPNGMDRRSKMGSYFFAGPKLRFRHALLRDAAYNHLSTSAKQRIHRDIVRTLQTCFPASVSEQPAYIAHHCAAAGDYETAVEYGRRAAERSLSQAANREALEHAEHVLAWIPLSGSRASQGARIPVNNMATQALMGLRGWADPEVKASIDRSRRLLEASAHSDHYVSTMWSLMTYHYVASHRRELRRLTEELLTYADRAADASLAVAAQTFLGLVCHGEGAYDTAAAAFESARSLYEPGRDREHGGRFGLDSYAWSTSTLALVNWFKGDTARAIALAEEAVRWAESLAHIPSTCIALLYQANLMHYADDAHGLGRVTAKLSLIADQFGLAGYQGYARIMSCFLSEDERGAESVLSGLEAMGCTAALSYYRSLAAEILVRRERYPEAVACLDRCLELCEENEERYYEPELHRRRGELLAHPKVSQYGRAAESLRRAADTASICGMVRTEALALAALARARGRRRSEADAARLEQLLTDHPQLCPELIGQRAPSGPTSRSSIENHLT